MEYLIKPYPPDTGALEIQDIEEYGGEFPRQKPATEIMSRLRHREFLTLIAEAPLLDDPGMVAPVSFKVVQEVCAGATEPKLKGLVARLHNCVRFEGRKVLYSRTGGTRRDWRSQGHFRALPEESEAWSHKVGVHEVDVVTYDVDPIDSRESKVYLRTRLTSDVLRSHTSTRTVVYAD